MGLAAAPAAPFIDQSLSRVLPADYAGNVLLWDIDKTYLDTRFSTWRGLARIPFELAIDKRTIPGAVPVLRALRRGPGGESAVVPLLFVSGSPVQLRKVIERRMTLDGVDFDGITFKDQLGLLLKGRPRGLTAQVGYKLTALLLYRRKLPDGARWLLFGDDVESDAQAFALFGDVCAGLRGSDLGRRLKRERVSRSDTAAIVELADPLTVTPDPVEKIFIHLEQSSDPSRFTDRRVVATRSYIQTILVLLALGHVRREAVSAVARDFRVRGVAEEFIEAQLADAALRLGIGREALELAARGA
jgi:hypothetical protein